MKPLLLTGLLLCMQPSRAQSLLEALGARYIRLAALTPSFATPASMSANPASLAYCSSLRASIIGERRFSLSQLSSGAAEAVFPASFGAVGGGLACGGSPDWQELSIRGAFARKLGERGALGIMTAYTALGNGSYGRAGALVATAGLIWQAAPGVQLGLQASNPGRAWLGKTGTRLPASYSMGVGWQEAGLWMMGLEIRQADGAAPAVLAGFEYVFSGLLRGRCGIDSALPGAWLGVGVTTGALQLGLTVMLQRELGGTPALTLLYPAK